MANTRVMVLPSSSWRVLNVLGILRGVGRGGETSAAFAGTDRQLCLVLQMWSKSSKVREDFEPTVHGAPEVAGVRAEHTACCRVVGIPKESRFLEHRSCSRNERGPSGGWNIKEPIWPKLERASSDRQSFRLREAQARPCVLDEKKHLLLATGQIKWCWR